MKLTWLFRSLIRKNKESYKKQTRLRSFLSTLKRNNLIIITKKFRENVSDHWSLFFRFNSTVWIDCSLPPTYFSCFSWNFFKPILPSINEPTPAQIDHTFWRPSDTLLKVLRRLHEIDYTQFPCVPCSYCSRLLYPNQIKWITRQTNSVFPFEHVYPHIPLITHPRHSTKVAVCPSCKLFLFPVS